MNEPSSALDYIRAEIESRRAKLAADEADVERLETAFETLRSIARANPALADGIAEAASDLSETFGVDRNVVRRPLQWPPAPPQVEGAEKPDSDAAQPKETVRQKIRSFFNMRQGRAATVEEIVRATGIKDVSIRHVFNVSHKGQFEIVDVPGASRKHWRPTGAPRLPAPAPTPEVAETVDEY